MSNQLLFTQILPFTPVPEVQTHIVEPLVTDTSSFALADGTLLTLDSIEGYTYRFVGLSGYERIPANEM